MLMCQTFMTSDHQVPAILPMECPRSWVVWSFLVEYQTVKLVYTGVYTRDAECESSPYRQCVTPDIDYLMRNATATAANFEPP